jgi:hypothetical protein
VLLGLHELLFQSFRPEYCVTEALKHVGLLTGPLRDVLQHTTDISWVLNTKGPTTQRCQLLTFIHCSAWRTASR